MRPKAKNRSQISSFLSPGGSPARETGRGHQPGPPRHRHERVLQERGVGHPASAGQVQRGVLRLLR